MNTTGQSLGTRLIGWIRDRAGLEPLEHLANEKVVPVHRQTVWYYLGGMTLFFFMVQVATGILLMLYYRPSAAEAYESVQFIMTQVRFGWLIRSIHSWSANLMVACALIHMFSVLLLKSYRKPRELTWLSGFILLVLAMGFGFSGYLLPWNTLAYFATRVGTDIAGSVPVIGEFTLRFLRGGEHVTGGTLSRFYGWHVALLPAIATALLGLHLMLVQRHGMSIPPSEEREPRRSMRFVPDFLLRDLFGWTIALGVLGALAALFPWELGVKADPFAAAPADIRPEWYFMFMFQTLKFVPGGSVIGLENEVFAILGFALAGLGAFLLPFLDRSGSPRVSRTVTIAGWAGIAFIAVMTSIGYHAWWPAAATVALIAVPALLGRSMAGPRGVDSSRGNVARGLLLILATSAAWLLAAPATARAGEPGTSAAKQTSSCVSCHASLDDELGKPAAAWGADVHAAAGLGCQDCHGGDPSPATAEDPEAAMSPAHGFRPAPGRLEVPAFCSRCHSDAAYMKRFNPGLRVDQLTEYRTSVHGKKNAAGDDRVAVCTDCHGIHGIRAVSSPDSPVYASNVPGTCGRCHSDAAVMGPYGVATDQLDAYRRGVHGAALLEQGDVAAPACNDCHGNHGATPPEVSSIAHVCGQCHAREARLLEGSRKKAIFEAMGSADCTTCHGNHFIRHPTQELFHSGSAPVLSRGSVVSADPFQADLGTIAPGDTVVAEWRTVLGLHGAPDDARWAHHVEVRAGTGAPLSLDATVRPNDATIPGRTARDGSIAATLTLESLSGLPVQPGDVLRLELRVSALTAADAVTVVDRPGAGVDPLPGSVCLQCHQPGDVCDRATGLMHTAILALDRDIRESAALLRKAEIAGMDVSEAQFELKSQGVTAAVESRALVHAFDPDRLLKRSEEGRGVARHAREAALAALAEVQHRRVGLAVSLVLVGLVLVGLRLKMKEVERHRHAGR